MRLSIVIPTYNRYQALENTLNDLLTQFLKDAEILVVDQSNPYKELTFEKVRQIHLETRSASKARNIGLLEAKGEVVLFLDDDVEIKDKGFLLKHLKHYEDPKTSGVTGPILSRRSNFQKTLSRNALHPRYGWMYFPLNYSGNHRVRNGGSGNLSVRRKWAIDVGGMDERFEKGAFREETDFCLRYTDRFGKLIYDPSAFLKHLAVPSGGSRSWELGGGVVHGYQHMFGGWYLMFRKLEPRDWPRYSYSLVRRFLIHKKLLLKIYLMPLAVIQFIRAFLSAAYYSSGPLLIAKKSNENAE